LRETIVVWKNTKAMPRSNYRLLEKEIASFKMRKSRKKKKRRDFSNL
jgi:hypothetical protein